MKTHRVLSNSWGLVVFAVLAATTPGCSQILATGDRVLHLSGAEGESVGVTASAETPSAGTAWQTTGNGKYALESRPKGLPEGKPWVKLHVDMVERSNDAKEIQVACNPKLENETCNGLDDDCDGQIDEACGLKSGGLQITMAWENHGEMDLQVKYVPWGESSQKSMSYQYAKIGAHDAYKDRIHFGKGKSGATLIPQADGQGSCTCNATSSSCGNCTESHGACWANPNDYVENFYLDTDRAPPGMYEDYFFNNRGCPRSSQDTVTVAISVNGETIGHYRSGDKDADTANFPILELYVPGD